MGLMPWIGQGCAWLFKLVALPFAKLGSPSVRPVLRWVLHVALVLVSVGCLTYLNIALELDKVVRAPSPILRTLWLPLLFLMVYSLAWLAWWIWKTATAAADPSQFPDIDEAWQEGLRALEQAQIDPTQTPLYLVLGRPASGDTDFFPASGLNWEVPLSPRRSDASVRICATRDAIFVSLAKVSTVGLFVERLASKVAGAAEDTPQFAACRHPLTSTNSASSTATATAVTAPKTVQRGLELIEQSLAMLQKESDEDTATAIATDAIGLTDDDLETANRRLTRICQLIAESRTPYCPANGIVVLIPWQATESQEIANRAAVIVDRDLRTVEHELQLSMPRVTIITDIQAVPGGREMIQRMPVEQRNRRFGVRFPHLAASDVGRLPELAEQGLSWLCQQLLPGLVYRVLSVGDEAGSQGEQVWASNVRLYRFMHTIEQRESRLLRLLERGVISTSNSKSVLSGLYFTATGGDRSNSQAFVPGVLPQLFEMQNAVAWLPSALRADAICRRWTRLGYVALTLAILGLAAIAISVH